MPQQSQICGFLFNFSGFASVPLEPLDSAARLGFSPESCNLCALHLMGICFMAISIEFCALEMIQLQVLEDLVIQSSDFFSFRLCTVKQRRKQCIDYPLAILEIWDLFHLLCQMRTFYPSDSCSKESHLNSLNPQSWLQVERGKLPSSASSSA